MKITRLSVVFVLVLLGAGCTERDRSRTALDSGTVSIDAGTTDGDVGEAGTEGGVIKDAGTDAGPVIGSCLGACGAAALFECPSFDRSACQEQCASDQTDADAADCFMEYRVYLGCRQTAAYSCNESGQPETMLCDEEEAAVAECLSGA